MGVFDFIKDAGEKLLAKGDAKAAKDEVAKKPTPETVARLSKAAGDAIANYVRSQGLAVTNLAVAYDAPSATATVSGTVPDQATREKVVLCCGNVDSVEKVNDELHVTEAAKAQSQMHTVVRGDTLSKIAAKYYGSANKYHAIFEANKPMLSDPDKIYPGQVLRIPPG